MTFNNQVALITGSGSGIGAATALIFAKEGADIVIVDKNGEGAKNTSDEIEKIGKKALIIVADISKDDEANEVIKKTIDKFGKLDILINNAGIIKYGLILNDIMEVYDEIMNTNLRAMVLMTSLAAPYLVQTKGRIVNISSIAAYLPKVASMSPAYAVSKAGVITFTKATASELAPAGVRVNAVAPGPVDATNIAKESGIKEYLKEYAPQVALGRNSVPSEIADLILYLVSDKARSITGSCYLIDNGMHLM